MEHVKIALLTLEPQAIVRVANHKYVPQDRFSKLTVDVLNATHTQELILRVRYVSLIIVMIDKSLDLMDLVLTAQILKELKELALLVEQTNATSDREFYEMVPVNTVNCLLPLQVIEEPAQSQLANQW